MSKKGASFRSWNERVVKQRKEPLDFDEWLVDPQCLREGKRRFSGAIGQLGIVDEEEHDVDYANNLED